MFCEVQLRHGLQIIPGARPVSLLSSMYRRALSTGTKRTQCEKEQSSPSTLKFTLHWTSEHPKYVLSNITLL